MQPLIWLFSGQILQLAVIVLSLTKFYTDFILNIMLRKFFSGLVALIFIALGNSFTASSKVYVDSLQAGSQYMAYPVPAYGIPELSPAPQGFEPFHMEHYGRHGSRWRIHPETYAMAVEVLRKAADNDALTPRGMQLLEEIQLMANDSKGRLGELTPLGHRQHRGIAARMTRNFPELFSDSTILDAKSTEVIRCILSMANEVAEFQKLFPGMNITMDASQTTQNILNFNPNDPVVYRLADEAKPIAAAYRNSLPKPDAFFNKVFSNRNFVADSIGEDKAFKAIFDLAVNVQSHDDYPFIYDVFTPEELSNEWLARNAEWYIRVGNTPLTKNRTPYNQRVLLRSIIESADTAMLSPHKSVNLRFGHETMLIPLSVLMELNNASYETSDLSTLADNWRAYEIFPMGGNIQMIFYRPEGDAPYTADDILVKVLLNEAEATLPVTPAFGNYYPWKDLRDFYIGKLDSFASRFEE